MIARRLAAIDATDDDERVRVAIARALSTRPHRLYLFRHAARVGALDAARAAALSDARFLDDVATYLLANRAPPAPPRPASAPLLDVALAVVDGGDVSPLAHGTREVELLGAFVCMAVPRREALVDDEIDNAHVWIAGGAALPSLEARGPRSIVVSPGDVGNGGAIAYVELNGPSPVVTLVGLDGAILDTRQVDATKSARLSVRG